MTAFRDYYEGLRTMKITLIVPFIYLHSSLRWGLLQISQYILRLSPKRSIRLWSVRDYSTQNASLLLLLYDAIETIPPIPSERERRDIRNAYVQTYIYIFYTYLSSNTNKVEMRSHFHTPYHFITKRSLVDSEEFLKADFWSFHWQTFDSEEKYEKYTEMGIWRFVFFLHSRNKKKE